MGLGRIPVLRACLLALCVFKAAGCAEPEPRPKPAAALAIAPSAGLQRAAVAPAPPPRVEEVQALPARVEPARRTEGSGVRYPLHAHVTSTVFWVGEAAVPNSPANATSAWDDAWQQHFGGVDDPRRRHGLLPATFVPRENPFYVALPFNDFAEGGRRRDAERLIPWAHSRAYKASESMCKNRWVRVAHAGRTCYAQWEDVGPFLSDDAAYVFGNEPPRNTENHGAGIDVSPAVRDELGLGGTDTVEWQFVDEVDVPVGPWSAIVTRSQTHWR